MSKITDLDLTLLVGEDHCGYAVNCRTFAEAQYFVDYVREFHPEMSQNWDDGEYKFDRYEEATVYTFDMHLGGNSWTKRSLMYGELRECVRDGYKILSFDDICARPDIEESDKSLDFLFGGVV